MTNDSRKAVLLLHTKNRIRVLIFEDHNDAFRAKDAFKELVDHWSIASPEHYGQGEYPPDMPPLQRRLKMEGSTDGT